MPGPFSTRSDPRRRFGIFPGLKRAWLFAGLAAALLLPVPAGSGTPGIEKEALAYIQSQEFDLYARDLRCRGRSRYKVFLIDNFELTFRIIPELATSHGELLVRLLKSGRDDIEITPLNTTLARGLATVLQHLARGGCADAAISSIPGSNYSYDQIRTLLPEYPDLNPDTRITHREALKKRLREIAFNGFPSVKWMEQADLNLTKLREDAEKLVFIQALERFNVKVILPYGNPDTPHRGDPRSINLLSLADNALVYTGLDREGRRVKGFPYSPLSSGDETAVYTLMECPHPDDPSKALLDINEDGFFDYVFTREPDGEKAATRKAGTRDKDGCRTRGTVRGTSVIPPLKVKEFLPPK